MGEEEENAFKTAPAPPNRRLTSRRSAPVQDHPAKDAQRLHLTARDTCPGQIGQGDLADEGKPARLAVVLVLFYK
jgi:hypothetical protein